MAIKRVFTLLLSVSLVVTSLPTAQASDTRTIDVVSVTWQGAKPLSVTTSDIESAIRTDVGPRWKRYTSFENSPSDKSIFFTHGRTLEQPIVLPHPMACEGSAASSFMQSIRAETYKRLSISDYLQRYLIILVPESGCIWLGRALTGTITPGGGVLTIQNSASPFIIAHELGHTLGLGHSNFLRCDSGKNDGAWGSDCKALEYGGSVDVMGNVDVDSPLSVYHQWRLGYLEPTEVKQSWVSEKIELVANDIAGSTRAIFIRDGQSSYWVEYRRANFSNAFKAGLVIYRTDPPPSSAILSPNPEDALSPDPGPGITTDYWMLNWNDYRYVRSQASGSMTLPYGNVATTFSGAVSITASPGTSDRSVTVSINRRSDTTPPPAPELIDPSQWISPGTSIIAEGYDDGESAIASFDLDINGVVTSIDAKARVNFTPTYLNPLSPLRTLYSKDLPEGEITLAVRGVDISGNKSPWSKRISAFIDRGAPQISENFEIASIDAKKTALVWKGTRDLGIGLCSTTLENKYGFVMSRSLEKSSPTLNIETGEQLSLRARVMDCLGNGMAGDLTLRSQFISPEKTSRVGKWAPASGTYPQGVLRCKGRCSISISGSADFSALIGEGSATISSRLGQTQKVATSSKQALRLSPAITLGSRKSIVRITGENFVFGGIATLESSFSSFTPVARISQVSDPSLTEPNQAALAQMGFSATDFSDEWNVLPIARGTTLADPTLDLCGLTYRSEQSRQSRRQVSATRVGSPYIFLSTEVVRYRSATDAAQAFAELLENYKICKANKGGVENGVPTEYIFNESSPGQVAISNETSSLVVRATINSAGVTRYLLAVYQFRGPFFTGLYVVLPSDKPMEGVEVERWVKVATVMASRLAEVR